MSGSTLWRAVLVQAVAVGGLFALLLALPLPSALFREQGIWIGPLAWLVCALVTARVLRLGLMRALVAAAVSGLAAAATTPAVGHAAGMVIGVGAFGLVCAGRLRRSGSPTTRIGATS